MFARKLYFVSDSNDSNAQKVPGSISISSDITEHITFLHKTFPVPLSMRAIIEVDVSYPNSSDRIHDPIMGIYTTHNHVNIKKQCSYVQYSQLGNRPLKCLKEGLDTIHCTGNITIQDYKPRSFSFSFGFNCDEIIPDSSLERLDYNLTIHEQTNETNCISLPRSGFHQHGLLPDLIGGEDVLTVMRHWESFSALFTLLEGLCYIHVVELGCYAVIAKCDPESRQVIHPCSEMCHDFRTACSEVLLTKTLSMRQYRFPLLWIKMSHWMQLLQVLTVTIYRL